MYRLFSQLVEGSHAHFEMFFLRILDFVVANAVKALDKHHYSGHARARDFGGIMQRTGWQPMTLPASFVDGSVAHADQIPIEENRFNLPQAVP